MLSIIQEYSNHLEEIFENSFDYIYLHDKEGNILDVNNIVVKNLGYSKIELLNMKVTDFLLEDIISEVTEEIKDTMETGLINKPRTYKVKRKDGSFVYIEASAIPLKKNGNFYAILGIGHDVTAHMEVEQKLKNNVKIQEILNKIITLGNESTSLQEFLAICYDQVLDIVGFDRGGIYLYNPKSQHNILVLHKNVHPDFIAAVEDVDISKGLFADVFNKNKPYYIEDFSEFMENSKDLGVYSAAIIPLRSKDEYVGSMNIGSPIHQILSQNELELLVAIGKQMGIIIQKFKSEKLLKESEEKYRNLSQQLEEKVNERTRELKQSEEKYRDLFNGMSNGVAVYETLDEGETFIFKDMNPSGEKISGVKREDIIGKNVLDLFPRIKPAGLFDTFIKVYKSNIPVRHPIAFYGDETISRWAENYVYKLPTGEIVAVYDDLTELKIAEQKLKKLNEELEQKVYERTKELKESEEKFRAISEQSFMSIMVIQDGILKYFNDRLTKRSGYSAEEIKSWTPNEFAKVIHPDDREFVIQQAIKKQEGREDVINNYIYRSIRKDGEIRWNENFSKTINYGGRKADLVMSVDITDKLEAEQILKESEEKFRTLFEKANDGILLTDAETEQIITGNKKISDMLGYSLEELRNLSFEHLHPKESLPYIDGLFGDEQQEGSSIAKDIPMKRKDGSIFYCNVNSSQIELAGKTHFMGIFRDITERKIALQNLKESEEKFRNITEQSFMGIIIIQNGELKYMNKALSKISGYSIDELLNWSQKDILKIIHPDDIETISKRFQSNIEGTMGPFSSNVFRIINKNGDLRWLEDYTTRIVYQGKLANLISVVDITERKEVEQLIIEENKRLLELHELRKDLITRVSHELKTPITSIYGASQILTKLYMNEIGEEPQKYIEIGHRGCLRLKQLIDNLLDVSRLDAKRFELKLQREDLVEQIIDCVKDMNYLATDRQLKMKLELPNEIFLEIDRLRFRQVLTNIISNAIKNTPMEGEIFIDLVESAEFIDIRIKDTGVGITEKEKEKLFEKFGKIERYGMDLGVDIEGSGLGLYISKEIVELHGGQIFVYSEGRNQGSTFTIRLSKN